MTASAGFKIAFRSIQGWLSLSETGPGEGGLQVVPFLKESVAYYMLRPFLPDVPDDVLCGAAQGRSQEITKVVHSLPSVCSCVEITWHDGLHKPQNFSISPTMEYNIAERIENFILSVSPRVHVQMRHIVFHRKT